MGIPAISESPKALAFTLGKIIAVLLFVDLFVAASFEQGPHGSTVLVGCVIGICAGQLNLISIWAAISRGPIIVRLPWAYLLLFFVWAAVTIGMTHSDMDDVQDKFDLGIVLFVCCTVAQIPLWIASRILGWQLCRELPTEKQTQFSISHMILGTTLLAISLAIARQLLTGFDKEVTLGVEPQLQFVLCVLTVANLVMVVPFIWISFFSPAKSTLFVPVVALVATIIECIVFSVALGPGGLDADFFVVMMSFNCAQILVVTVVLRILKRKGFRLVRVPMT